MGDYMAQILFTDVNELSKYNEKLLEEFVTYLNSRHEKTGNVFHCGARVQILSGEELVKDFNKAVTMNIAKDMKQQGFD